MIYLGTVSNLGSDVVNNKTTAAPFAIPSWVQALRIHPSAATQMAATKNADDAAFLPAAANMLQLGAANSVLDIPLVQGPWSQDVTALPGAVATLAIRKTDAGAGTCKVFGIGK